MEASEEIVSTMSKRGMARRVDRRADLVDVRTQPVDVSLWTTQTALIACVLVVLQPGLDRGRIGAGAPVALR